MSRLSRIAAWGVIALAICPALAHAQTLGGENGVKVGEGRLHPYFDLEFRLDSAAGLFNLPFSSAISPELILHARPGLRLEMPQGGPVYVDANGYAEYLWYTGLLSPASTAASRFQGALSLNAAFNKTGPVEFDIGDQFSRSDRTTNVAIALGVLSLYNELKLAVPIHPGGGALEIIPSGAWSVEFFQPISVPLAGCNQVVCDPTQIAGMNYNNFEAGLTGRWKFLPKTAVLIESTFDTRSYQNPGANPSPLLLRAQAGLAGLLTPKVTTVFKAGWAQDFGASGAKSVIGHFELGYLVNESSSVKVGYLRTIAPVPTYGTNGDDKGYLDARFLFGGRLSLRAYAAYDYLSFYSASGRNDSLVTLDAGPDYQFTPWLIVGGGYTLTWRQTNQLVGVPSASFVRHEGYLRFTFTY